MSDMHTPPSSQSSSSNSLSERDQQVIWHPYTQMQTADPPIGIVKSEGAWLYTENGKRIFDGISSWWVNLHGHAHPWITQKVSEQLNTLEHVIFSGFTHSPAVELAERLLVKLPRSQKKIFYSDNGSTAVEVAIKQAIQFWKNTGQTKTRILALEGGYHGDTFGAMAVSGRGVFTAAFESLLFDVGRIPFPDPEIDSSQNCFAVLEKELASGKIAAMIYEPLIQGAGGMRMYSPQILEKILILCKNAGVLLIADEVMTGFYRTGTFLASEQTSIEPDLICLSKGLTGGTLPLGATSCTQNIFDAFLSDDRSRTFFHGHSFTGNPLSCAAALASLDLLEKPECLERIERISKMHQDFANELEQNFKTLFQARALGSIFAMDFPSPTAAGYLDPIGPKLYRHFISNDLLLRPMGNTLYILPPYCTTDAELTWIYECIRKCIQEFDLNSN